MFSDIRDFFRKRKYLTFILTVFILTWLVFMNLIDGELHRLENSIANLSVFFFESLWPPDWKVFSIKQYNCTSPTAPWPLPADFFCSQG